MSSIFKPDSQHSVNLYFSILLIALGAFGFIARYIEMGDFQFTALIPFIFGIILVALYPSMKKGNRISSHVVVLLTLIITAVSAWRGLLILGDGNNLDRRMIIFLIIVVAGLTVLFSYIMSFINARRDRNDS